MAAEFKIRKAAISDMEAVFELSNDDIVRQNSINKEKISLEKHKEWFKRRIAREHFYIAEVDGNLAAQVRIDDGIISISIKKEYRGKGLGAKIIRECSEKSGKITALINENNPASIKAFEKAGYKRSGKKDINGEEFLEFKYE